VTVTARGAGLAAIAADGIRLRGAWGEHGAPVAAAESVSGAFDLVVVATKAGDLEAALEQNAGATAPRWLVVRNGLGARDAARRLLSPPPGTEVLGGLAVFAASSPNPGEASVTAAGPLYVGGPEADAFASALQPALPAVAVADLAGAEWTKLIVNQVNALPAITGLSAQQTIADPTLRRVLTRSIREAIGVARMNGVRFAELQGLSDGLLRGVCVVPPFLAQLVPLAMARRMGSVPNPGSTLQSIRRGRRTEIDWLNGAVVAAARAVGAEAPVNSALTRLVHEVESTGRFFSVDEVSAAL